MTQLQRVKKWLGTGWASGIYDTETAAPRYYLYTFDRNNRTWEGMFWHWADDDMADKYRHVLDLKTKELIR